MKKLICLLCVGAMVLTGCTTKNEPTDGGKTEQELATYTGKGSGYGGELTVEVDMLGSEIKDIRVIDHKESSPVFSRALPVIKERILEAQSPIVDSVSAATFSSYAVKACLLYTSQLIMGYKN